jgi:transposase
MDGDRIALSQEQLRRWHLLKMVLDERICLKEASERMGVCYRQAKRMKGRVARDGPRGLVHGNQGRKPANALGESQREKILELSRTQYPLFNDTHFWQQLATAEGIRVSRETVRQIRRNNGIAPKRRRRRAQHRARRLRKPQEGMMVLWDGSPHRWFGPDKPPCSLMAAMDDATGKCVAARFFPFESSAGYLWLLRQMVCRYGIPLAIYQDQHSALKRNDDHWSLEEQLRGEQDPTQVGWALRELAIEAIYALSPQAKGRIERLFGTLQDRLLAEMQKTGILEIEPANEFLQNQYLQAFNTQFGRKASEPQKAWRSRPPGLDLDRICSLRYEATVGNDNTVRLGGLLIDIPAGPYRTGYAKLRVEVRQLLDGSWRVYYQDRKIAQHPATELKEPLRTFRRKKKTAKATVPYSWVYQASAPTLPP